jgi:methylenetetrahydrofolate dehydrogenase (NADP+)/methenyltetrahydrofolate cyclohydrolase
LHAADVGVRLDTVIVGDPSAGIIYARSQERRCRRMGIDFHLHTLDESTTDPELHGFINDLSRNPSVTGIMLNLPLPERLDTPAAQYTIDPYKDVEGVNPSNIGMLFYGTPIIAPCTAMAVMAILHDAKVVLQGVHAVVVGQGSIAGRPIASALISEDATVTTCNVHTRDLAAYTRQADVLIAAAGVPELIGAEHVKDGAVVIDVGINTVQTDDGPPTQSRVVGDVKFDEVCHKAAAVTPVPGGVGPVTVAILMLSTVEAADKQLRGRRM